MTLGPRFSVHVEKPVAALADALRDMRTWLDHTALEPIEFKVAVAGVTSRIAFDVTFGTAVAASRFEQAFN
jgi:hypothetical protein